MSEYFLWESVRKSSGDTLIEYDNPAISDYIIDIQCGKKLNEMPSNIIITPEITENLNDDILIAGTNAVLFSNRLLTLFNRNDINEFDCYPCKTSNNGVLVTYYIIVIRDIIYCLDNENSDLQYDPEEPDSIDHIMSIAINEKTLDKKNDLFFRLGELKNVVVVHKSIKAVIEDAGITGVNFTPADGTYPIIDYYRKNESWMYNKVEHDYSTMLLDDGAEFLNENFPVQKYAYIKRDESC